VSCRQHPCCTAAAAWCCCQLLHSNMLTAVAHASSALQRVCILQGRSCHRVLLLTQLWHCKHCQEEPHRACCKHATNTLPAHAVARGGQAAMPVSKPQHPKHQQCYNQTSNWLTTQVSVVLLSSHCCCIVVSCVGLSCCLSCCQTLSSSKFQRVSLGDLPPTRWQ
jgi:hypothetical protein